MSVVKMKQSPAKKKLTTHRMVMSGVFGAICIALGVTGLGFIPVPNLAGYATILHIPVIIAGALEGPLVGALTGLIMGIYSLLTPSAIPPDPIVCVLPRILIGIVSAFVYKWTHQRFPRFGAALTGLFGTLTNTLGFVGLAVLFGYLPAAVWITIVPQALVELVLAMVLTVVLTRTIERAVPRYRS